MANGNYASSTTTITLTVTAATPTLSGLGLSATSVVFGATAPTITAPTSASSGAITYTSGTVGTATITSNGVITLVGVGTTVITATQVANGNYASSTTTITLTVGLPSGYIVSGGLTWAPITTRATWSGAESTCMESTALGGTWRQPTEGELSALYAAYPNNSATLNALGWTLGYTWSSTVLGAGLHYVVILSYGFVDWVDDSDNFIYVSCVH